VEIDALEMQATHLISCTDPSIAQEIANSLQEAKMLMKKGRDNSAWSHLMMTEQLMVKCMSSEQRKIKANSLRIEATKFSEWRKKQIFELLGAPREKNSDPVIEVDSADKINEALNIRREYYNTRNHRMALRRASLDSLSIIQIVIIVLVTITSFNMDIINPPSFAWKMIVGVLFGALGASYSMANSLTKLSLDLKIPDQMLGIFITLIRLAIGSTSAIILLMLLQSGFLKEIFSDELRLNGYGFLVFSFLSGFSERWVVKILDSVATSSEKAKK
jgi:hypothetical protein